MVKKKSHEERHDEAMPEQEIQENQTNTESDASGQEAPEGEPGAAVKSQTEDDLSSKTDRNAGQVPASFGRI